MNAVSTTTQDHLEGSGADLPALLEAAGRGDERAWRAIVDLYARRIYALAKSRLGSSRHDLAEEITQSVFVTVASKIGKQSDDGGAGYAEQGKFESWLFRIAMNRIRDEVRRSRRQAEPTNPVVFNGVAKGAERGPGGSIGGSDDVDPDAPEELKRLRGAIEKLSESDREVVELRHHAGLSFKQMAELLSEPIGTLLARHHRALKKLKELLGPAQQSSGTGVVS